MPLHALTTVRCLLLILISFLLTFFFIKSLILISKKKDAYQVIKDDIVKTHLRKNKTPSLGGVAIIASLLIALLIVYPRVFLDKKAFAVILTLLFFFFIGLIDDVIKVFKHDAHGLSPLIRILLEVLWCVLIMIYLNYAQHSRWQLMIFDQTIYLGIGFILLFILVLIGSSNALNLSDGLDGLSSILFLLAMLPFLIFALKGGEYELAFILSATLGSLLGFLCYNLHPAKIFMGDCGSLSLGSILGIIAILLKKEYVLVISGFLLIVETLSVIIQVGVYKSKKKRVFLMAPLHHHFEMKGVPEWKVVMSFYVVGLAFSILGIVIGI